MLLFLFVCFDLLNSGAAVFDALSDPQSLPIAENRRVHGDRLKVEKSLLSVNWVKTSAPTNLNWVSIASSSTGQYFFAVVREGGIYTSNDYGITWTVSSAPSLVWAQVAASSTGEYLAAVVTGGGIYNSSNYGFSWTQTPAPIADWRSIASDSTGQYLAAAANLEGIYTSNNFGITWVKTSAPSSVYWRDTWGGGNIAASSTGQYLAAVSLEGFYSSNDYGTSWLKTYNVTTDQIAITSSSTGQHLAAVGSNKLFTSSNYGASWVEGGGTGSLTAITSDSTGQYLHGSSWWAAFLFWSSNYGSGWGHSGVSDFRGNFISIACSSTCQYVGVVSSGFFNVGGISILNDVSRKISSSSQPSSHPTSQPSSRPSDQPSGQPSNQLSGQPTQQPSHKPSPTVSPTTANPTTASPTADPISSPTEPAPTRSRLPPFAELYDRANFPATKRQQSAASGGWSGANRNTQSGEETKTKINKMKEKVAAMRGEL